MAISVDWPTGVISVPLADLTPEGGTLYRCDTNWLRLQLKALEESVAGMPWPRTNRHNTEYTIVGTTFFRSIEIINGYSIQFTPDTPATVILEGSNNNFWDVQNGILVQNQVQVVPTNSAGGYVVTVGSGLSAAQDTKLDELHKLQGLDAANPMTVTPTNRSTGTINQNITGDGTTTTTVTRT